MNDTILTIFSCPKAFKGHAGFIQRNAIKSWTLLRPKIDIILIGDETGTADICREYGLRHARYLRRNNNGTPFIDSVFEAGREKSTSPFLAYVNSDIVLLDDFVESVRRLSMILGGKDFLFIGGKWDIEELGEFLFDRPDRQNECIEYVRKNSRRSDAFEYFVYPRDLKWNMPPLYIRPIFDNWLVYKARCMKIPVVDGTAVVNAIHQKHDHLYYLKQQQLPFESPEVRHNLKVLGFWHKYTLKHCTHVLTAEGLKEQRNDLKAFLEQLRMTEIYLNYLLKRKYYPYSYPLYLTLKQTKKWVKRFAGLFYRPRKELC